MDNNLGDANEEYSTPPLFSEPSSPDGKVEVHIGETLEDVTLSESLGFNKSYSTTHSLGSPNVSDEESPEVVDLTQDSDEEAEAPRSYSSAVSQKSPARAENIDMQSLSQCSDRDARSDELESPSCFNRGGGEGEDEYISESEPAGSCGSLTDQDNVEVQTLLDELDQEMREEIACSSISLPSVQFDPDNVEGKSLPEGKTAGSVMKYTAAYPKISAFIGGRVKVQTLLEGFDEEMKEELISPLSTSPISFSSFCSGEEGKSQTSKPTIHLLDKEFSIDEDILDTPLEPTRSDCGEDARAGSNGGGYTPPSILRRHSSENDTSNDSSRSTPNRVTFPEDQNLCVYQDPDNSEGWKIDAEYTAPEILKVYQESCKLHETIELETIKSQILEVRNNRNYSAVLQLHSLHISRDINETLEDVFKICNFRTLIICDLIIAPDVFNELFNMLEYYSPVREIELTQNIQEVDAWRTVCNACACMCSLQSITFRNMVIPDNYIALLLFAMEVNTTVHALKFEGCTLTKLPSFYLDMESEKYNFVINRRTFFGVPLPEEFMENLSSVDHTLRELYLHSSGLYTKEAESIARYLKQNKELKVLDLSHNFLGDRGLEVLAKGLITQNQPGEGLSVFVVANNQISEKSGPIISSIIRECKNLHTLNIGCNPLTDQVITDIADSLVVTTCLEGLGLQRTLLSGKGVVTLSAAIQKNVSLQKINLKSNKAIDVSALEVLCNALTNSKISRVEIDETNRSSVDPEAYSQIVKKLQGICTINRTFSETGDDQPNISQLLSRKISLSCEPKNLLPQQQCAPADSKTSYTAVCSSKSSSTRKSRFQISKVKETKVVGSRFRVSTVTPPPLEAEERNAQNSAPMESSSSADSPDKHDENGENDVHDKPSEDAKE